MLQIDDEDEAYHYEIQKNKLYGLATVFKGIIILPYFLVIIFYCQLMSMDKPATRNLAFTWTFYHALSFFLALIVLFFLVGIFYRKTF